MIWWAIAVSAYSLLFMGGWWLRRNYGDWTVGQMLHIDPPPECHGELLPPRGYRLARALLPSRLFFWWLDRAEARQDRTARRKRQRLEELRCRPNPVPSPRPVPSRPNHPPGSGAFGGITTERAERAVRALFTGHQIKSVKRDGTTVEFPDWRTRAKLLEMGHISRDQALSELGEVICEDRPRRATQTSVR